MKLGDLSNVRIKRAGITVTLAFFPAEGDCRATIASSGASMSRIGRFVVPDLPHHVTQRGNRREKVFFGDDDYALYRDLLAEACRREGVAVGPIA